MASAPSVRRRRNDPPSSVGKPPVKSILRGPPTPTVDTPPASVPGSRKRSGDGHNTPDSPTKRAKTVHFDFETSAVLPKSSKSLEEAKKEVKAALVAHAQGDDMLYNELKSVFDPPPTETDPPAVEGECRPEPQDITVYVVALTACAPLLKKSCSGLVRALLLCSSLGRDSNFHRAYCQCMAALVSAHGSYMMVWP